MSMRRSVSIRLAGRGAHPLACLASPGAPRAAADTDAAKTQQGADAEAEGGRGEAEGGRGDAEEAGLKGFVAEGSSRRRGAKLPSPTRTFRGGGEGSVSAGM